MVTDTGRRDQAARRNIRTGRRKTGKMNLCSLYLALSSQPEVSLLANCLGSDSTLLKRTNCHHQAHSVAMPLATPKTLSQGRSYTHCRSFYLLLSWGHPRKEFGGVTVRNVTTIGCFSMGNFDIMTTMMDYPTKDWRGHSPSHLSPKALMF